MKKILIALTIAISCLGINKVNADNLQLEDITYEDFTQYKEIIGNDNFNTIVNETLEEYKENYMSSYPYFYISVYFDQLGLTFDSTTSFIINLFCFKEIPQGKLTHDSVSTAFINYRLPYSEETGYLRRYSVYEDSSYVFDLDNYSVRTGYSDYHNIITLYKTSNSTNYSDYQYKPYLFYLANFEVSFPSLDSIKSSASSHPVFDYDNLLIPKLGEENLNRVISLSQENVTFEPYYLYDSEVNVSIPNIEEINLNDYAFIALSLKDYTKDSFETTIQVKGEYCVNAVYDYGLSAKEKYDSSVTDICSPYYDNYTPVRHYVLDNDIKNHAIYYLKAHDINKENKIKVDSSIFNIHYITEEEADNPIININGRDYSILPFDELPSNSIKNTEEGNWPGASEEFSFSDIFTAPLEFLKDIWDSIVSVFSLITEFISLLPPVMQNFIYASFMLGMSIGLIKLIF